MLSGHSYCNDCFLQVLRERVALGRKLVEAIAKALPARRVEAITATTPLGQRSRRPKVEPGVQRNPAASTPKAAGEANQERFRLASLHLAITAMAPLGQHLRRAKAEPGVQRSATPSTPKAAGEAFQFCIFILNAVHQLLQRRWLKPASP